jgi:hypothetical protein
VKIKSIKAGCAGLVFGVRVANPYEKGQNLLKRRKESQELSFLPFKTYAVSARFF